MAKRDLDRIGTCNGHLILKQRLSWTSVIRLESEPLLDFADRNLFKARQLFFIHPKMLR